MHLVIVILFGISAAIGAIALITSFRMFDRLLRFQFTEHRAEWQRGGGPIGFFWIPPEASVASGSLVRSALFSEWARISPGWITGAATRDYRWFRKARRMAHLAFGAAGAIITVGLISIAMGESAWASEANATPLLPKKLPYQETSIQHVIPYRDGGLVESDDSPADRVRYARFEAKETATVAVEEIELLFDAEQSADSVLFLGLQDKKMVMVRETADRKRHTLEVPEAFHPRFLEDLEPSVRPHLIPTNHEVAAIAGDVVWWKDEEWRNRKLPKVPQFYDEFQPVDFGQVHFLVGTTLYAGWNHGEWGGMLASLDLSADGAQWVHLSGKPAGDSGIPKNEPVQAILSPSPGHLWVVTGSLSDAGRGLHHRDPAGKWQTLINGDLEEDRGKLKFPVPSSIEGLAADRDGRVYILAGAAGVFRPGKAGLERLFAHDFFSHASNRGDYLAVSYPSDLAIARNGDLFVSTNSFGVLAFRKKDGKWSARQITLNKGDSKRLKDISFPPSRQDKCPSTLLSPKTLRDFIPLNPCQRHVRRHPWVSEARAQPRVTAPKDGALKARTTEADIPSAS